MANFGLYYPDFATAAGSGIWEPTVGPVVPSRLDDQSGIISDEMADGATQYDDIITPITDYIEWAFDNLLDADRTAFRAFRAVVRAVSAPTFEMRNPLDGTLKVVRFAPGGWDPVWEIVHETGNRLATKIRLRLVA